MYLGFGSGVNFRKLGSKFENKQGLGQVFIHYLDFNWIFTDLDQEYLGIGYFSGY